MTASGSVGIAESLGCVEGTEDTITLLVTWTRDSDKKVATSVHTASWTAPQRAGVHSNQSFHYMAAGGEVRVDQAKRGYDVADDEAGQLVWYNPVSFTSLVFLRFSVNAYGLTRSSTCVMHPMRGETSMASQGMDM